MTPNRASGNQNQPAEKVAVFRTSGTFLSIGGMMVSMAYRSPFWSEFGATQLPNIKANDTIATIKAILTLDRIINIPLDSSIYNSYYYYYYRIYLPKRVIDETKGLTR